MSTYLRLIRPTIPVLVRRKPCVSRFHISPPRKALPPVILVIIRPVLKGLAFLAGRNIRKWWRALPKEKKAVHWSRVKEKKWKIAGGASVSSVLAYCYYISHLEITPITGRERFTVVSSKQIQEFSNIEFKMLCEAYADHIVNTSHGHYTRISKVVNRLLKANTDLPQVYTKKWTITVLDDPNSINAFVLPNGNIFVFSGMLALCTSDDELGIILGHEMAHSLLGHAAENVTRENVIDSAKMVILFLLSAVLPTDLLTWLAYAVGAGFFTATLRYPYGRSLEEEADEVGLQLAAKACFDVRAASAFWAKMDALEGLEDDEKIDWLSTHPSHKARQQNIENQLHRANNLRRTCQCPDLPASDPRKEVEAFREAVLQARMNGKSVLMVPQVVENEKPVAIILSVPKSN